MTETSKAQPAKATARKAAPSTTDKAEPTRPLLDESGAVATENLAAGLALFQANLPEILKGKEVVVEHKDGGSHKYSYANLAKIHAAAMPLLARCGLAFTAWPNMVDGGGMVLEYTLMHVSGEEKTGIYPLPPSNFAPQAMGSAITYARRYTFCSVTGIIPDDEDDDGQAASGAQAPAAIVTNSQRYAVIAVGVAIAGDQETLRTWSNHLDGMWRDRELTEADGKTMRETIQARMSQVVQNKPAADGMKAPGTRTRAPQSAETTTPGTPGTPEPEEPRGGRVRERAQVTAPVEDAPLPEPEQEPDDQGEPEPEQTLATAALDAATSAVAEGFEGAAPSASQEHATGDPDRIVMLEKFVKRAKELPALRSQFEMVAEEIKSYTEAERQQIGQMFDVAYERITGEKRPRLYPDWK